MILSDYRINLVNAPLHKLDFIPGGTSFVDQTLAGEKVTVSRCFFLSIPSLSDHPYIYFEVLPNTQSPASGPNNTSKSIPHISSINQSLLNDKIAASLRQSVFQNFPSKEQVQVQIANLTKVIADSVRSAKKEMTDFLLYPEGKCRGGPRHLVLLVLSAPRQDNRIRVGPNKSRMKVKRSVR